MYTFIFTCDTARKALIYKQVMSLIVPAFDTQKHDQRNINTNCHADMMSMITDLYISSKPRIPKNPCSYCLSEALDYIITLEFSEYTLGFFFFYPVPTFSICVSCSVTSWLRSVSFSF